MSESAKLSKQNLSKGGDPTAKPDSARKSTGRKSSGRRKRKLRTKSDQNDQSSTLAGSNTALSLPNIANKSQASVLSGNVTEASIRSFAKDIFKLSAARTPPGTEKAAPKPKIFLKKASDEEPKTEKKEPAKP